MRNTASINVRLRGFSLVELLVVTAIVIVLAGVVSATTVVAIKSAKKAKCAAHMSQIGKGLTLYLEDHAGYFPPYRIEAALINDDGGNIISVPDQSVRLVNSFLAYGVVRDMWFCPLDEHAGTKWEDTVGGTTDVLDHRNTSYRYGNGILLYRNKKAIHLDLNIAAISQPSRTAYLAEKYWGSNGVFEYSPHGLTNNYLYLDGHVKEHNNKAPLCDYPGQDKSCPE